MRRKPILILAISLIMSLVCTQFAFATQQSQDLNQTTEVKKLEKIVLNEYDYIKDLSKKTPAELKDLGFDDKEITKMPNIVNEYRDKLKEQGKQNDQSLKLKGYTDSQIETLRSFTGSEEQLKSLSATLTMTPVLTKQSVQSSKFIVQSVSVGQWISSYQYLNGYTKATISANWAWSSCPIFGLWDVVGFAWSGGFVQDSSSSTYNYHKIKYITSLGYTYVTRGWSCAAGQGCSDTFCMALNGGLSDGWAQSGTAQASLTVYGYQPIIGVTVGYGHSTINVYPSVGFSSGDLSFSPATVQAAEQYSVYYL
ncbi:hypothetical protein [Dehalobacter sp.]|uniref:hypothetical protein n=1 Tax=Dehalobacter sp. TaxID=1962289 RepID=UPI00258697DA|nr:hypothetical protein [Dehalobacter sp.]MCG1024388.1 hypothetical protein [Dehalobacter sp.]